MNIAIDLGKRRSYVVIEENKTVVKEGYTETSKEGFDTFIGPVGDANIIVESGMSTNRVAEIFEGHNIIVANPRKVRIIAESVKKTDKIDAHTLLDLYEKDYLPKSWLPNKDIRDIRNLCRNRDFLVKQRTAVKNRIRYQVFLIGEEFRSFSRRNMKKLDGYPVIKQLVAELDSLNNIIYDLDKDIAFEVEKNSYANLLFTIPGIGKYSALAISSQIGDISRFADESHLFAYAGLVPIIRQSGDREFRGHITKGDTYLKTLLVECVQIHIKLCANSFITRAYRRIKLRSGHNKAKIAAARRLLQVIYFMLKRNEVYLTNE